MSKYSPESLKKYIGKSVDIKTDGAFYYDERVVRIKGDSLITEYYHHIKTREDGLMRDHWINISTIKEINLV